MRAAENTRFHVDLLHPGRVSRSWQDWVTGARGGRRLALVSGGASPLLAILFGRLPESRRLGVDSRGAGAHDRSGCPRRYGLRCSDRPSLPSRRPASGAWASSDTLISDSPGLKLQRRGGADGGRRRREPARRRDSGRRPRQDARERCDRGLPPTPGRPALVDLSQFWPPSARSRRDRRLRPRAGVKPSASATAGGDQVLAISIVLTERAQ